jgi:hypothetical protein
MLLVRLPQEPGERVDDPQATPILELSGKKKQGQVKTLLARLGSQPLCDSRFAGCAIHNVGFAVIRVSIVTVRVCLVWAVCSSLLRRR